MFQNLSHHHCPCHCQWSFNLKGENDSKIARRSQELCRRMLSFSTDPGQPMSHSFPFPFSKPCPQSTTVHRPYLFTRYCCPTLVGATIMAFGCRYFIIFHQLPKLVQDRPKYHYHLDKKCVKVVVVLGTNFPDWKVHFRLACRCPPGQLIAHAPRIFETARFHRLLMSQLARLTHARIIWTSSPFVKGKSRHPHFWCRLKLQFNLVCS